LRKSSGGKRRPDGIGKKRGLESRKRNGGGRKKREGGSRRRKLGSRRRRKLRPDLRGKDSRRQAVMMLQDPSSKASTSVSIRRNKRKFQCGQGKKIWSGLQNVKGSRS
jgi:hypothetical protein